MQDRAWLALVVCVVGMVVPVVLAALLVRRQRRRRTWTAAAGTVRTIRTETDSQSRRTRRAHYVYRDAHGQRQTGDTVVTPSATKGATIPILYDPQDPARSQVDEPLGLGHLIGGGLGLLVFLVALVGVVQTASLLLDG